MELWKKVLIICALVFVGIFFAITIALIPVATSAKVAVIPLEGVIAIESSSSAFGGGFTGSSDIVDYISQANADPSVDAILLKINSPGGSAVASDEIARAIEGTDKPVVAWIRESGASGAYWAAAKSDHIIANRMSITGSVGVIASYLNFNGLLDEYNVTYVDLKSGKYKDIGSPLDEMLPSERAILDAKLERIHQFFLDDVQLSRNLSDEAMDQVETGIFFLGIEAYEIGLIDQLGGEPEVEAYLEDLLGSSPRYEYYERQFSFFESLASAQFSLFPSLSVRSQLT